jgi:hypothetical protein
VEPERFDGLTDFAGQCCLAAIWTVGSGCIIASLLIVWTVAVAGVSVVTAVDEASRAVKRRV